MVIGIVVNVLEDEHVREREAQDQAEGKATLDDLILEIRSLRKELNNLKPDS
jgi:voltage-gated sodium channel